VLRGFSLALGLALLLSGAALAQSAPAVAPDAEQEILRLVNHERQSRGLEPLSENESLRQAARRHSELMAKWNTIGHQLSGEAELSHRIEKKSQPFDTSGENVAVASDGGRAHSALMHSPGHRANILDSDYNSVGIGVVRKDGKVFVTQDFAHVLPESSVADVEWEVAATLRQGRRGELKRVEAPELRRMACEMASHDRLNPHAAMLPGANSSAAFTALDLNQIPRSLRSLRSRSAGAFSVGACYQSSASYGTPVYWVVVVTYPERPSRAQR